MNCANLEYQCKYYSQHHLLFSSCFENSTLLLKFFLQTFEYTSRLELQIKKVRSPNKKILMHKKGADVQSPTLLVPASYN